MRCYAVVLAGILMGSLAIFVRNIHSDPITITFLRLSLGALLLLPLSGRPNIPNLSIVLVVGVLNLLTILCYISAIMYTKVAIAALLLYMAPIYVTAYVWLFEGKPSRGSLIAIPLSISGLILMLSPYGRPNLGVLFGLLSGMFYAMLFITMKKAREVMGSIHLTFTSLAISSAILLPFVHLRVDPKDLPWIVGLGIFPTALAFTLFSYGIKFCRTERAPILALVEPVSAGVFGYLFFGEILGFRQVLGAMLILAGLMLSHVE